MAQSDNSNGVSMPAINGKAYAFVEHTYDVVVVGAGGSDWTRMQGPTEAQRSKHLACGR